MQNGSWIFAVKITTFHNPDSQAP